MVHLGLFTGIPMFEVRSKFDQSKFGSIIGSIKVGSVCHCHIKLQPDFHFKLKLKQILSNLFESSLTLPSGIVSNT